MEARLIRKTAGKVKNVIQPAGKTIVSFDLQLCAKAVRLHMKPDIKRFPVSHERVTYCVHPFKCP